MKPVRILHFSDLHGHAFCAAAQLVRMLEPDWIVLTGDMIPGHLHASPETREQRQTREWTRARPSFLNPGAVTTYLRGNHEGEHFHASGCEGTMPAVLDGRVGFLEGIPAEFGPWGFPREMSPEDLQAELAAQGDPMVILSHVPPFGCLDRTRRGVRVGHRPLAHHLAAASPALVLCGHVHESWGFTRQGKTLVVNAAGGAALVQLDPVVGHAEMLEMRHLVHPIGWFARLWPGRQVPDWLWSRDYRSP